MQRREFLAASGAAALGLATGGVANAQDKLLTNFWYELRNYRFASEQKLNAYAEFLQKAGIEAITTFAVQPVGLFRVMAKDNPDLKLQADPNELWLLLACADINILTTLEARLQQHSPYLKAGRTILHDPQKDPSFDRYQSWLLKSFSNFPQPKIPTTAADRLLQLRRYESHNMERARSKIYMMNNAGELDIFKDCGMSPVFFGEACFGADMPNLTYMLSFENAAAEKAAWKKFRDHPKWKPLSADPNYKDTVSRITNLYMRPLPGSQI